MTTTISKVKKIVGEVGNIAADKSISHRCAIFSLLSHEASVITNFLRAEDTFNSLKIAQALGAKVKYEDEKMIFFPPRNGIQEPANILDCGNAGTAMRLYAGLLAGVQGYFVLSGDEYLRARPMNRVIEPLRSIGAKIYSRDGGLAPLSIIGSSLRSFDYQSPIASAQVKSAMILSALRADDECFFSEPRLSRDHTERMLSGMGVKIQRDQLDLKITPLQTALNPLIMQIPSDPSSAFFLAVAAAILPDSQVFLKNVLLNPTRIEAFEILKKMGARVEYEIIEDTYEKIGHIFIAHQELNAIEVSENIAWLIDEIPALSVAMAMAKGKSRVKNAKELRVKECDRIKAVVSNLSAMGIRVDELEDGFEIEGGELKAARVDSFGDHRIAMSFAIAGLVCGAEISDFACVNISFPNFLEILQKYCHQR